MKKRLILDFDDCIVQSTKAYCHTYTYLYKDLYNHPNFKQPDYTKNTTWDFSNTCPLEKYPESIFSNKVFFDKLTFMPNAKEVIERLSENYELVICTIGTHQNVSLKVLWIEEHLPIVKNIVPIINEGVKMDKSIVNMVNSIFIDDNQNNLFSSNAERKILFNHNDKILDWNKDWIGEKVTSWLDLEKLLNK